MTDNDKITRLLATLLEKGWDMLDILEIGIEAKAAKEEYYRQMADEYDAMADAKHVLQGHQMSEEPNWMGL